MSRKITIRLPHELAEWLAETSRLTGVPVARIVRQQLEIAMSAAGSRRFLRHAGKFSAPPDLSARKGFSKR